MKPIAEQANRDGHRVSVIILTATALCIGIYLIVTTVLIAEDGVTFIGYAKQLETAPVKTMLNEYQHPGYPAMILAVHEATRFLQEDDSIMSWIYSGQAVSLTFRVFTLVILYFIAVHLFGLKTGFWAVLIFTLLPKPAEYGSDVLSDWPALFFLLATVLLLLKGVKGGNRLPFGLAGIVAAMGYLVRPEIAEAAAAGGLLLLVGLLRPNPLMSRGKTLLASALLFAGFLAIAGPYMNLKGAIFPKKNVGAFTQLLEQTETSPPVSATTQVATKSPFTPSKIAKAAGKVLENTGETLMWFFMPALFIGMYHWFKTRKWYEPEALIIIAIIALNVPMMIWLYCKYGYMSDRHTLPLLVIPILFVPVGLREMAGWCYKTFSSKNASSAANRDERFWYAVLFAIGVSVCLPKLFTPIRMERQGYRFAANWLKVNTDMNAIVAVPNKRISFYAERTGLVYENERISEKAEYIVRIFEKKEHTPTPANPLNKLRYEYINNKSTNIYISIYERL